MKREDTGELELETLNNQSPKNSGKIISHVLLAITALPSIALAYVIDCCVGAKVMEAVYDITMNFTMGGQ